MAKATLQQTVRHIRDGEFLVASQRGRVTYFESHGDPDATERARLLLKILEESLELHRGRLAILERELQPQLHDPQA